ncbi:MAG: hypothetical protein AB8F34_04900, partial [Akkermansiaceae bacterium]
MKVTVKNEDGSKEVLNLPVMLANKSPHLDISPKHKKYDLILITNKNAEQYLGQYYPGNGGLVLPSPAFLAIPAEATINGTGREGVIPFLIGNAFSSAESSLPQLISPKENLRDLVAAIYSKETPDRSDRLASERGNSILVDSTRWGGAIGMTIKTKRRGIWEWITRSPYGKPSNLSGFYESTQTYTPPPISELVSEMKTIERGWLPVIRDFVKRGNSISKKITLLEAMIRRSPFPVKQFEKLSLDINSEISKAYERAQQIGDSYKAYTGYFVSPKEAEYYAFLVGAELDRLSKNFNTVVSSYYEVIGSPQNDTFDSRRFLYPPPIYVQNVLLKPAARDKVRIKVPQFKSSIGISTRAFLVNSGNQYRVVLNGLMEIESALKSMEPEKRKKIYAET